MAEIQDIWAHAHHMIRSARQLINESLRPLNLSSAEGNILLHLLMQGQEMGQDQLVEQLDISKPAVSRALDSLEKKGYISREQNPNDRRAYRVLLSSQAREIAPTVEQAYNQLYAVALQGISPEELNTFIKLFQRMSENFHNKMETKSAAQ
jgi:MarR family transcriptional regulator for hemolysin